MSILLSICIPTFNRAQELERQLTWLAEEIKGFEAQCEVIVSDNCSEDATPQVVKEWHSKLANTRFKTNRNPENIGWMRNFHYLVGAASGKYIWIVGDDDPIARGTLAYVLKSLAANPDLSLIFLNFSDRHNQTGEVHNQHYLPTDLEEKRKDGIAVFEKCLERDIGAVIFITSTIFQTQYVCEALEKWPTSLNNWAGLAYWAGNCAMHGSVLVTKENFVECTLGASNWGKAPQQWFYIIYRDIPSVYKKLKELGFSPKVCNRKILELTSERLLPNYVLSNLRYLLWCFKSFPKQAIPTFCLYLGLSVLALLETSSGAVRSPLLEASFTTEQRIPNSKGKKVV
ncbi:MAG: glycosyltransferase family 2 protein [Leptolyngbyaceae cyanobacterium bins.302]|nr:glycosyltransferase family 2 protein [Leptolyngbyaceae cyanobacterium bins.302]